MILNKIFINDILNKNINIINSFNNLGLTNSNIPNTLSFIDSEKYLDSLISNNNITGVFTTKDIASKIESLKSNIECIIVEDPRYDYYFLFCEKGKRAYIKKTNKISPSAIIHVTAFVAKNNVIIGNNVIIEPNVTILSDVEIGDNCIIRSGTVVGTEGFEYKRTSKGLLPVYHDGKVIIGDNVELGANNAVSKGFSNMPTIIGSDTKTDNLVHIAHGTIIGKRCFLTACAMTSGSVTIEDDVWLGPNSTISSQVTLKESSYVTIGSVVTRNTKEGEKVTGNFAIPHKKFMENLKNNS